MFVYRGIGITFQLKIGNINIEQHKCFNIIKCKIQ